MALLYAVKDKLTKMIVVVGRTEESRKNLKLLCFVTTTEGEALQEDLPPSGAMNAPSGYTARTPTLCDTITNAPYGKSCLCLQEHGTIKSRIRFLKRPSPPRPDARGPRAGS